MDEACRDPGSKRGHSDLQSFALPTEPPRCAQGTGRQPCMPTATWFARLQWDPQLYIWSRGVTVSTLDSESSNRGSHPRGTSFTVEPHVAVYSLTPGALSSKFFVCRSRRCVYLPSSHAHTHRISEGPARVIWEPQKCLDDPAGIRAGPSVNKDLQAPMRRDSS